MEEKTESLKTFVQNYDGSMKFLKYGVQADEKYFFALELIFTLLWIHWKENYPGIEKNKELQEFVENCRNYLPMVFRFEKTLQEEMGVMTVLGLIYYENHVPYWCDDPTFRNIHLDIQLTDEHIAALANILWENRNNGEE